MIKTHMVIRSGFGSSRILQAGTFDIAKRVALGSERAKGS